MTGEPSAASVETLLAELAPLGRDPGTGGFRRFAWTEADAACRAWFRRAAESRRLDVETDRNGNLWAWWGRPGPGAVATGSHLDSVPGGGAYDGPLGVVSALLAVDLLRARGVRPRRALALAVFADEEGARFGTACVGSRLATGTLEPQRARGLLDAQGVRLDTALAGAGVDPAGIGPDPQRLAGLAAFVELHVEQGRALADLGAPVAVASAIWPHGRWRVDFPGSADHAGTTRLPDRHDPMLPLARLVLQAREQAAARDALATVGRVQVQPNATNAVPARATAWLDARARDEDTLTALVQALVGDLGAVEESRTPAVVFDRELRDRLAARLDAPLLDTGAGHDAGILAAAVPTAMLFVRNPTGVSHSPAERAEPADCAAGVATLAAVLEDLLCR